MSDDEDRHDDQRPAAPETYASKSEKCSKCGHVTKPYYGKCPRCEGMSNRQKVDALAGVIRELKDSAGSDIGPEREQRLFALLLEYGHPDPKGFMGWLSTARDEARSNKPKPRGFRR